MPGRFAKPTHGVRIAPGRELEDATVKLPVAADLDQGASELAGQIGGVLNLLALVRDHGGQPCQSDIEGPTQYIHDLVDAAGDELALLDNRRHEPLRRRVAPADKRIESKHIEAVLL